MKLIAEHDPLAGYVVITLDGVDVTLTCAVADEQGGLVERERLVLVPGKPHTYRSTGRYTTRGQVVVALEPDAPEYAKAWYLELRQAEAAGLPVPACAGLGRW